MKPRALCIASLLTLLGWSQPVWGGETIQAQILSEQAIAYLDADARLVRSEDHHGWVLESGVVRVACSERMSLEAGGRPLALGPGVARLAATGPQLRVCVDEGQLELAGQSIRAGECAELRSDGSMRRLSPDEARLGLLLPPPVGHRPLVPDDPWAVLEQSLASSGLGTAGEGEQGEAVETGGGAACLDTSSGGVEASGPEGTELPEPEVDRAQHRVHIEVTLEGF